MTLPKSRADDKTRMPFGKYKDTALGDVPPGYLLWLYEEMKKNDDKLNLFLYIANNLDAIQQEADDEERRGEAYRTRDA